jgi:hypothetical protein
MKFALTITDATPSELSALLLALNGSTAPFVATMQNAAAATGDDGDETGPVNVNAPAVDKDGLPWDERIHSSNKALTDKGVWRKRRGVPTATITAVEAELRARGVPAQQPVMQPHPMTVTPAPVMQMPAPQPIHQPAPVMQMPAPQPMPMQPAPVMQMPAPQPIQQSAPAMDFATFMQALSGQMQKRDAAGMPLIDTDYLARTTTEIATAFGVPLGVITDIVSQPRAAEMIVYAVQCMQRDGKWG